MVLVLDPLDIMSHQGRTLPVHIILMRTQTEEFEGRIFSTHTELKSESRQHRHLRKTLGLLKRLRDHDLTVSIDLVSHPYGSSTDRFICHIYLMEAAAVSEVHLRRFHHGISPYVASLVLTCAQVILYCSPSEIRNQRTVDHFVATYDILYERSTVAVKDSSPWQDPVIARTDEHHVS